MKDKGYLFCLLLFLAGMLSVSISNVFGGYYCSVAAISIVLFTFYVYKIFDGKHDFKQNLVMIILMGMVTLLETVLFVANDIFNVVVYTKNNFEFFSVFVIISQIISIFSIIYLFVVATLELKKSKVELVENNSLEEQQVKEDNFENKEIEIFSPNNDDLKENNIELKSISNNAIKVETPFMEEEK